MLPINCFSSIVINSPKWLVICSIFVTLAKIKKNLQSSEKQIKNVNAQKFNNSYRLQLYFFFYLFRFSQSNSEINVNLDDSIDFRCPFYPSGTSSSSYKYYLVYIVSIQSSSEYPSNPFEE